MFMGEIERDDDRLAAAVNEIFINQDVVIQEHGHGVKFDRFRDRYDRMPDVELTKLVGNDIVVECTSNEAAKMELRPIAQYGMSLVVEDVSGNKGGPDAASYLLVCGSIFFNEDELPACNKGELDEITKYVVQNGNKAYGPASTETITDLGVIYSRGSLCRDAHIVTANAHTLKELRNANMRGKTANRPLNGSVITVQRSNGRKLTLFVEDDVRRGIQIKNVYSRDDNGSYPQLSYI